MIGWGARQLQLPPCPAPAFAFSGVGEAAGPSFRKALGTGLPSKAFPVCWIWNHTGASTETPIQEPVVGWAMWTWTAACATGSGPFC